jgi:hypothetical protein
VSGLQVQHLNQIHALTDLSLPLSAFVHPTTSIGPSRCSTTDLVHFARAKSQCIRS